MSRKATRWPEARFWSSSSPSCGLRADLHGHHEDDREQHEEEHAGKPDEVAETQRERRTRPLRRELGPRSADCPAEIAERNERDEGPSNDAVHEERLAPRPVSFHLEADAG